MSIHTMTYGHPHRVSLPQFGHSLALASAPLTALMRRCSSWLDTRDGEPRTSQEVLAYARRIEDRDPGLASDLRGAAMRDLD
jgi:hypothetical protein